MTKCTLCKKDIVLYSELQDSFIKINHRFYHLECAVKVKENHTIHDYSKDDAVTIVPSKPRYKTKPSISFWGKVKEKCISCGRPKDHHTTSQVKECMT